MAVIRTHFSNQVTNVFSQLMLVGIVVCAQYLGNAINLGRFFSNSTTAFTGYQYSDVAADFFGSSNHTQGNFVERGVIVFGVN